MRLEYRILWVDDQVDDFIEMGIKDDIIQYLNDLAFKADIDCYETADIAERHLLDKEYDLILSDYNIDGSKSGKDLIDHIREGEIFTEILFYSAKSDFDEVARSLYQDRVSYLSLVNDDGFRDFKRKVTTLISLTIKKLQELNSIRGLVMAETSSLDNDIVDILSSVLSTENSKTDELRNYILTNIKKSSKDNLNTSQKLETKSNEDILKSRIFDSDKKARSLSKMISIMSFEDSSFNDFYQNYKRDVLQIRNDLAHAKSLKIDGIEYLALSRKEGEQHVKWNQEECILIRKNLLKYSDILAKLKQNLT